MTGSDTVQLFFRHQPQEKLITQVARGSFGAEMLGLGVLRHIAASAMQLQSMAPRQFSDEPLVPIRLFPPQIVVEVHYRQDNPDFRSQLQQQSQEGNRIGSARYCQAHPIAGFEKALPPNVLQNAMCQLTHATMLHPRLPNRAKLDKLAREFDQLINRFKSA